jgi:hypothetical protein
MSIGHSSRTFLCLALSGFLYGQADAQSCSNYLFPKEVATVDSARIDLDRVAIVNSDSCPDFSPSCQSKSYLVRNDVVFRSSLTQGTHTCVAFFNGKRQTTGWVETKSLVPSPTPVNQGSWAGHWKRITGDSVLIIRRSKDGGYQAEAVATYAVARDNVRTGAAEGKLVMRPSEGGGLIASFSDPGQDRTAVCHVDLRQFGPWLLVDDGATDDSNSACGGMGVTLNGIYRKTEKAEGKPQL